MLPFVYNGNGDGGSGYDCERRSDRYRRSGSRSRSRDRSRSRSWSRDRRRRSHYSRSRSTEKSRSRSRGRSRSHSRSRNRSPRQIDDGRRRSVDRDRENLREFSSALPYLSSMQAQSQTDKYASHTALYGQPHYKIVMKMLPTDSQRDALMALTARQGFRVKDIRIIHKGPDRCFGFVEFADVNSAQAWMEYNKGTLLLDDGRPIKLEYSRYDSLDGRSSGPAGSGDWMCAKCTIKNFKNRGACFKCNLTRIESDGLTRKGYAAIGVAKCDTLLLREIPLNCTETKIQAEMNRISSLDVLRVHIAESGLYAYVQMRSADDAERLMLTFNKIPLLIDGCTVMVTYSRLPLNTVLSTTAATESMQKTAERISQMPAFRPTAGPSGNAGVEAAQLALAKAQLIRQMANSLMAGDAVPPSYPANAPIPPMLNRPPPPLPLETNFVVTDYFKDDPPSERNFVCVDDITNQDSQTPSLGGIQTLPPSYSGPEIKGAADLGFVETPWGRYKRYRAPNPTLYQFEPSSGLYYDPSTGLYYDSNSQYYWDANAQKWNCWNAMYQTYVPCDMMSRQGAVSQEVVTNNGEQNQADEQKPEAVKEEPKKEPQKTAKDIAREMARWAKKQSKVLLAVKAPPKLETTSPLVTAAKSKTSTTEPTADITYKMLGKTSNPFGSLSDDEDEEEIPPAAKIAAVGASRVALNSKSGSRLPPSAVVDSVDVPIIKTSQSDENFVDMEKKYCILCKRKFASLEILLKHVRLSDLHKKNLEAHLMQTSLSDTAPLSLPSTSTSQDPSYIPIPQHYRDRAKERRNLFGLDPSGFTSEGVEVEVDYAVRTSDTPIDETNIGNKLLKSMGWQEGTGIGKNNQGILTPIATELRVEGAGLGATSSKMLHGANASRRERARSSMMSRFQELQ